MASTLTQLDPGFLQTLTPGQLAREERAVVEFTRTLNQQRARRVTGSTPTAMAATQQRMINMASGRDPEDDGEAEAGVVAEPSPRTPATPAAIGARMLAVANSAD